MDPADRCETAVHLLRRIVDRRQLRAGGAVAAGFRHGAQEATAVSAQIHRGGRHDRGAVRLLFVFTTRWTVIDASKPANNPLNARTLIDEQT
jgi:hypothetical protein